MNTKPNSAKPDSSASAESIPVDKSSALTLVSKSFSLHSITNIVLNPRFIAASAVASACGLAAVARFGFQASLLESGFWAASFAGLGLGAASFVRVSKEISVVSQKLEYTRRQMATTARVLAETLEQSDRQMKATEFGVVGSPNALVATSVSASVNPASNTALANIARAQIILANRSEADINVLSGIVRDLTEAVTEQERELVSLRFDAGEARKATEAVKLMALQMLQTPRNQSSSQDLSLSNNPKHSLKSEVIDAPVDRLLISRLESAFVDDGFAAALQPIVTLPQRKVKVYELSLLLKGDAPSRTSSMIRKAVLAAGLASNYDRVLIERALVMIRHFRSRQKEITVLCEITGSILVANQAFDSLMAELRQEPDISKSLVLALGYDNFSSLRAAEKDLLPFFVDSGVRLAVTGLTDMRLEPAELGASGIRFVSIDVTRLMEAVPTGLPGLDVHVADLAGLFKRRKIDLIVQNISSDRDLLDIIDMEIPLAQGKLLGETRPLNPELADALAQAMPQITAKTDSILQSSSQSSSLAQPSASSPIRQPLRNFLRRA